MKFVISDSLLMSFVQPISQGADSKSVLSNLDMLRAELQSLTCKKSLNYNELNLLFKLITGRSRNLTQSQYEILNTSDNLQFLSSILEQADLVEDVKSNKPKKFNYRFLYSGSTKQLLHNLAIFTGHEMSTLFRVLRNTLIHSLSIFFGLCCSCSGYIFDAISGTSTHPVPSSL